MNIHYTFLLIDVVIFAVPFVMAYSKRIAYYKTWPYLWPSIIFTTLLFSAWDIFFTQWNVWDYNDIFTIGVRFFGLPIEEYIFYLVTPFAGTFLYEALLAYLPFRKKKDVGVNILFVLGIASIDIGIYYRNKIYTYAVLMIFGAVCLIIYGVRNKLVTFRGDAFLVAIIAGFAPFFLVERLLTMLPVVMYNTRQITGLRVSSIPVEDIAYSMLVMMVNVVMMERLRSRITRS